MKRRRPEAKGGSPSPSPRGGGSSVFKLPDEEELRRRRRRNEERFGGGGSGKRHGLVIDRSGGGGSSSSEQNAHSSAVVGTCTSLEKSYLRLTCSPNPAAVRPPHILKKALKRLKRKWRKEEDYAWACDQLKAMRQDLTVQQGAKIDASLAVDLYQTHARIALETGDMNEYNQCQSQLLQLKRDGIEIADDEFTAYGLLYSLTQGNAHELMVSMARLTSQEREGFATAHAVETVLAHQTSNYHRFFVLYRNAPHMGGYLMDYLIARMRKAAFSTMMMAYKPTIDLDFIVETLAFETREECAEYVTKRRATLTADGLAVDVKHSPGAN